MYMHWGGGGPPKDPHLSKSPNDLKWVLERSCLTFYVWTLRKYQTKDVDFFSLFLGGGGPPFWTLYIILYGSTVNPVAMG